MHLFKLFCYFSLQTIFIYDTSFFSFQLQKALYLRELRIVQMENMLAEFVYGVDVYLEIFRDSNVDYSKSLVGRFSMSL